ncbi:hypothetical protein JTB14_003689 [Gonioctena quinquepunctata]|nr:hypothetical protein JTB14_003689 [Gonioctena quinquepunctata]
MDTVSVDQYIPQWKKDLIARLKNQNKTVATVDSVDQQLYPSPQYSSSKRPGHQPILTCKSEFSESVTPGVSCSSVVTDQCNVNSTCSSIDKSKMVQERVWVDNNHDHFTDVVSENYSNNGYHKNSDSDSSEDLHYGPGIVKKLKNKYLSLALRESTTRPSILHMRKATSLENLLDDDIQDSKSGNRNFRLNGESGRNAPNRYRNAGRQGREMKRARSVETISRIDNDVPAVSNEVRPNRQSLHEEMLIAAEKEGNDHPHRKVDKLENKTENKLSTTPGYRVNRPKRIQPMMNEREKPPADVVKQAKMIFERRPEQRTRAPPQTGDVAAKVDSFNNIIVKTKVEAKVVKKPPVKVNKPVLNDKFSNTRQTAKPVVISEEKYKQTQQLKNLELNKVPKIEFKDVPLPSPIPDVSRIDFHNKGESVHGNIVSCLSETPDLILTSSPLPILSSPTHRKNSTEDFINGEIRNSTPTLDNNRLGSPLLSPKKLSSPLLSPNRVKPASPLLSPSINKPSSPSPTLKQAGLIYEDDMDSSGFKRVSPTTMKDAAGTAVFNFTNKKVNQGHLPVSNIKTPPTQQLKIEVNGHVEAKISNSPPKLLLQTQPPRSPPRFSPPPPPIVAVAKTEKPLTVTEIEKNSINIAKTAGKIPPQPGKGSVFAKENVEVVNKNVVPKKNKVKEPVSNTAVFNFTSRKDVPDYISNDRSRTPGRPEKPKPGEGGIILLPNAIDSFIDEEEEEIARSLERPLALVMLLHK